MKYQNKPRATFKLDRTLDAYNFQPLVWSRNNNFNNQLLQILHPDSSSLLRVYPTEQITFPSQQKKMKSRLINLTHIKNLENQKYPSETSKQKLLLMQFINHLRQLWNKKCGQLQHSIYETRHKHVVQPDTYHGTSETLKKLENRTQQDPTHAAGIPPVTYSFLVFSESPLHRFLRSKLYKGIPSRTPHRVSHDCYTIGYNLQPC